VGADWTAQQISVLRVCFDHILQRGLLKHIRAPRKPRRLPTVLNRAEIRDLIASTRDLRSYLILALLYGCGLKPGELRLLTWDMLQASRGRLCLPAVGHSPARTIPLPRKLRGLLRKGKESGVHGSDYIFPGRMRTDPLSQRVIEHTVRQHTKAAGIRKPVTAMTLRHSYAVHQLETGMNLRQIQLALGHRGLHAALRYAACVPPNYSPPEPDAQRSPPASSIPAPPEAPLFPLTSPRGKIRSWLSGLQLPWRPRPTGPPGI
jgi:site-specific recombinase XerD